MNVVCLNWRNYLGLGQLYAARLHSMLSRHLTIPNEFVEITERDLPVERAGWWNKLALLEMFDGDTLFLDLDIVITQNIDHLVRIAQTDRARVWMRDDFSYSIVKPRNGLDDEFLRLLGGPGCCNSSVMLWHGRHRIEETEATRAMHGDQNVITAALWPNRIGLLPNASIQSYKYGIQMRGEPPAPIVVMHGFPKNHEVGDQFMRDHWR